MKTLAAIIIIALLDPEENPYVFRPLVYWAMAIFCLIAPFLFSDRWWIQSALATIPIYWLLAMMAFASGLGSLRWRQAKGGRDFPPPTPQLVRYRKIDVSMGSDERAPMTFPRRAEAADYRIGAAPRAE